MLKIIFGSKTKAKLILLFFENPQVKIHMRGAQRLVNERINSVRSALVSLVEARVFVREKIGRRVFFKANDRFELYDEFLRLVAKKTGIGKKIINEKHRLGSLKTVILSSNYYRYNNRSNEIDLFIIGNVSLAEVAKFTKEEGERRGVEINYSVMSRDEFIFRKKNKDPFLLKILQQGRLFLVGKEEDLLV
jgi:hypothetical protein